MPGRVRACAGSFSNHWFAAVRPFPFPSITARCLCILYPLCARVCRSSHSKLVPGIRHQTESVMLHDMRSPATDREITRGTVWAANTLRCRRRRASSGCGTRLHVGPSDLHCVPALDPRHMCASMWHHYTPLGPESSQLVQTGGKGGPRRLASACDLGGAGGMPPKQARWAVRPSHGVLGSLEISSRSYVVQPV